MKCLLQEEASLFERAFWLLVIRYPHRVGETQPCSICEYLGAAAAVLDQTMGIRSQHHTTRT